MDHIAGYLLNLLVRRAAGLFDYVDQHGLGLLTRIVSRAGTRDFPVQDQLDTATFRRLFFRFIRPTRI
jgi:hypothetical protein